MGAANCNEGEIDCKHFLSTLKYLVAKLVTHPARASAHQPLCAINAMPYAHDIRKYDCLLKMRKNAPRPAI
jgi:hypothetical protein